MNKSSGVKFLCSNVYRKSPSFLICSHTPATAPAVTVTLAGYTCQPAGFSLASWGLQGSSPPARPSPPRPHLSRRSWGLRAPLSTSRTEPVCHLCPPLPPCACDGRPGTALGASLSSSAQCGHTHPNCCAEPSSPSSSKPPPCGRARSPGLHSIRESPRPAGVASLLRGRWCPPC